MDNSSDDNTLSSPSSMGGNKNYSGSHGTSKNTDKATIPSSYQLVSSTNDSSSIEKSENNNQIDNMDDKSKT